MCVIQSRDTSVRYASFKNFHSGTHCHGIFLSTYRKREFFGFFFLCALFNTASSASPQISLCRRMLGSIEPTNRMAKNAHSRCNFINAHSWADHAHPSASSHHIVRSAHTHAGPNNDKDGNSRNYPLTQPEKENVSQRIACRLPGSYVFYFSFSFICWN